jgi:hypothetical protein
MKVSQERNQLKQAASLAELGLFFDTDDGGNMLL